MTRRISSSIVFRTQAVHSACGLVTLSASAVVLAPVFCFGCCQALDSLSATSIAVCLNCGCIALRSTAFVHPVAFVLLLKRFLDNMHLVFQLGSFLFLCGFPRHLLYLCDLASIVSARTWFFTLFASVAVNTSSIMDLCLYSSRSSQSRALLLSVRVSDFVPFCILGFLDCGRVSLDLLHLTHIVGIVVLLLVLLVLVGVVFLYHLLNFVVFLDCFVRCNTPSLSRSRV